MTAVRGASIAPTGHPVLFVDLDDVICMSRPYGCFAAAAAVSDRHINPQEVYRLLFQASSVQALKQVHDEMYASLRYVVSSTWREVFNRAQIEVVFRNAGLGFVTDNLHEADKWCTPPKFGRSRRSNEISEWLDRHHRSEPFAITDDTCSGASLTLALAPAGESAAMPPPAATSNVPAQRHSRNEALHPFSGRVVLCEEHVGLTDAHVPFIVAALRREVVVPGRPAAAPTESETQS